MIYIYQIIHNNNILCYGKTKNKIRYINLIIYNKSKRYNVLPSDLKIEYVYESIDQDDIKKKLKELKQSLKKAVIKPKNSAIEIIVNPKEITI